MATPELPSQIRSYWGAIKAAADARTNTAGAFSAVNAARAAADEGPLSGIGAVQMGQLYSLAVQQRNARESLASTIAQMNAAEGATKDMLYNQAITSENITQAINSRPLDQQNITPSYKISFEVTLTDELGTRNEWRWINMGGTVPESVGQTWDIVQSAAEEMGYSGTLPSNAVPTGNMNILAV